MIYVDLDGVLVDLRKSVVRSLGKSAEQKCLNNCSFADLNISTEDFHDLAAEREFWTQCDLFSWSHEIINTLEAYAGDRWRFLSKVMKSRNEGFENCFAGKAEFVRTHFPRHVFKLILVCDSKSLLCRSPNDLLIDDDTRNINEWTLAGGRTFFWRSMTSDCEHAKAQLELLKNSIKKS